MGNKKRFEYIDVAKGLGILLVIFGHLYPCGGRLSSVIFSFHMPLFFFLSGIFARSAEGEKFFPYFFKKNKRNIVWYFAVLAIGALVTLFTSFFPKKLDNAEILFELYRFQPESFHVGQLWFLSALSVVSIYFFFFDKYIYKHNKIVLNILCLLIFALIGNTFPSDAITIAGHDEYFPLKIISACMGFVFFSVGYLLKNLLYRLNNLEKKRYYFLILPFSVITCFSYVNGWSNVADRVYHNLILYLFFAFSGILLILLISSALKKSRSLQYIGQNSMLFFSLQSFTIQLFKNILVKLDLLSESTANCSLLQSVIGTVFNIIVLFLASLLFNKVKGLLMQKRKAHG